MTKFKIFSLYILLFFFEFIIAFGTIILLRYFSLVIDFGIGGQNLIRYGSKALLLFMNVVWAFRMFEGKNSLKVALGLFSGILHLVLLYAIISWGDAFINENPLLIVVSTFLIQFFYWVILIQLKVLKYR